MDIRNNPRRRLEAKSVAEQAAEWLMVLEEKGAEANPAFSDWLRESPTHVQAYLRAATLDTMIKRADPERSIEIVKPEAGTVMPDIGPDLDERAFGSPLREKKFTGWRLAASVATLSVLSVVAWMAFNTWDDGSETYRTDVGEQRTVELQDGSMLTLNTDSRVQVHFTVAERQLRLLSGEASFRVQRDPSRPFRVHSDAAVIQAIGTEFNIYRKADRTTVSVLEGRVAVTPKDEKSIYLSAGEELQLAAHSAAPTKSQANIEKVTAWRQRRLVFVDEPLSTIGAEINRYNRAPKIRVEGGAQQRRYAVILDADDPESLVAVLAGDAKVTVEREADEIVVRER